MTISNTHQSLWATVGGHYWPVESWAQVSAAYRNLIARLDLGASNAPRCVICDGRSRIVAHVGYNGRVFSGEHYTTTADVLYEPA